MSWELKPPLSQSRCMPNQLRVLAAASQVKENFDRFISCKNTIDNIHARLKKTETDGGEGAHGASAVVVTAAIGDVRGRLQQPHDHRHMTKPQPVTCFVCI